MLYLSRDLCDAVAGTLPALPVLALHAGSLPGVTPLLGLAVGAYGLTQASCRFRSGLVGPLRAPAVDRLDSSCSPGSAMGAVAGSSCTLIARARSRASGRVGPVMALLADLTARFAHARDVRDRHEHRASFVISLRAGPLLAGRSACRGVFVLSARRVVALAIVLFALPAQPARQSARRPWRTVITRQLAPYYARIFMLHLTLTATFIAVPNALRNLHGIEAPHHWLVYLAVFTASIGLTVPLMLWSERNRNGRASLAGGCLLAGALVALIWAQADLRWLGAALALYFGAFNFLESRLPAALTEAAGEESAGPLGDFATCQFAGAFAGGLGGGALLGTPAAGPAIFLAGAIAAFAWLPLSRRSG